MTRTERLFERLERAVHGMATAKADGIKARWRHWLFFGRREPVGRMPKGQFA